MGWKIRRDGSVGSTEYGSKGVGKEGFHLFFAAELRMRLENFICGNRERREDLWIAYLVYWYISLSSLLLMLLLFVCFKLCLFH